MPVRASDLPYGVKQRLLNSLRLQLGSHVYEQMVGNLGEDGVVDLALQALEQTCSKSQSRGNPWGRALALILSFCGNGGWICIFAALGAAPVAAGIALVAVYLFLVCLAANDRLEAASKGFAVVCIGVAVALGVGLVGFGLWKGVPWMTTGVFQWFRWLGGHVS